MRMYLPTSWCFFIDQIGVLTLLWISYRCAGSGGGARPEHGGAIGHREGDSAGAAEGGVRVLRHGGVLLPAPSVARASQRPLLLPGEARERGRGVSLPCSGGCSHYCCELVSAHRPWLMKQT